MPRLSRIRIADSRKSPFGRLTVPPSEVEPIHLYGWDSRTSTWHGPNELVCSLPDRRLLQALLDAPGRSWYGPVSCCSSGESATRFFALVHDLSDCAVASIYCHESKTGPAEIVGVLPASRRPLLREDFAFEFVAFARFLGSLGAGEELAVHDAIATAIAEAGPAATSVFSISTGLWPNDLDHVLSRCVEKIAVTLCRWLDESPSVSKRRAPGDSISAA